MVPEIDEPFALCQFKFVVASLMDSSRTQLESRDFDKERSSSVPIMSLWVPDKAILSLQRNGVNAALLVLKNRLLFEAS